MKRQQKIAKRFATASKYEIFLNLISHEVVQMG